MHVYLVEHLTCFLSNDLKDESKLSLSYSQYFDIDNNNQKESQYYAFLDQLTLVAE